MRTLAASFRTQSAAAAALVALGDVMPLARGQVRLAALGHPWYPAGVRGNLLAGRFDEHDVAEVRALIERFGGRIVTDIDTQRTG